MFRSGLKEFTPTSLHACMPPLPMLLIVGCSAGPGMENICFSSVATGYIIIYDKRNCDFKNSRIYWINNFDKLILCFIRTDEFVGHLQNIPTGKGHV